MCSGKVDCGQSIRVTRICGGPGAAIVRCCIMGAFELTETNPYSSPRTTVDATIMRSPDRSPLRTVRVLFYFHIAVVCWFTAFTLSDTGQLDVPDWIQALFSSPVQMPLVFTWLACPVMISIAAWKIPDRLKAFRVAIVVGDALLSAFQLWVMLPLVR